MSTVHKDRDERKLLGINFADRLTSITGDVLTISAVDLLEIRDRDDVDVTAEFRTDEAAPTVDGSHVLFYVTVRASTEQTPAQYSIRCIVTLSNGEEAIAKVQGNLYPQLVVGGRQT